MRVIRNSSVIGTGVVGPELDWPLWDSGVTYAEGQRVTVATDALYPPYYYPAYDSVQAGNTNHDPLADDGTWWILVGTDNPGRMLDTYASSQTTADGSIQVTFGATPIANTVAMLNIVGAVANVTVTLSSVEIYNRDIYLYTIGSIDDWYEYFFADFTQQNNAIFNDLPSYPDQNVTVTLTGDGTVAIGTLVVGFGVYIGETEDGARIGITDYSRKTVDEFGVPTIVKRGFAKKGTFNVLVANNRVDMVAELLADLRAEPAVWIAEDDFSSTYIYGFYKDWYEIIRNTAGSTCALEIEGLTS